jgi:hypothetical protein
MNHDVKQVSNEDEPLPMISKAIMQMEKNKDPRQMAFRLNFINFFGK